MSALQRKIFSRWANQKLAGAGYPTIPDAVTHFKDGVALVNLIEALSERKLEGKELKATESRMQQIDQANRALKFVKDVGVVMALPPSAENLVDGDEKSVLGLLWGIMQRFLKFGDDEDQQKLSAEDSLLMWARNQLASYGIEVSSFTKPFHNGKAYAALIHKNRPKFINPAELGDDAEANLRQVFAAAQRYFDLEPYLEPSDIAKMDNKSAFIYLSEYYYGIAKMRRTDLACRRISKLVTYTKINDHLRGEYSTKTEDLVARLKKVTAILEDRTVDNTMAGAKAKIEQFNNYKSMDKPVIIATFLSAESIYNHLAIRLVDHKRPQYNPGEGKSVPELRKALADLETLDKQRQIELVAELNRQIRLAQLAVQHVRRYEKLQAWIAKKSEYVNTKENIESSGAANYQINRLNNHNDEAKIVTEGPVVELQKLGAELAGEKFEFIADVKAREATIVDGLSKLSAAAATKMEVLQDDLARMKVKEATHLKNLKHVAKYNTIEAWLNEKEAYLKKKEDINNVASAQLQLNVLENFEGDKKDQEANSVPQLKAVGAEILAAKYQSNLSAWVFENPREVSEREKTVDNKLAELSALSAAKKAILEADLARELEKERLRLAFATQAGEYERWATSLVEDLPSAHFGFNLGEVEAYGAVLAKDNGSIDEQSESKTKTFTATFTAAAALGVTENVYTSLTLESLAAIASQLKAAVASRQAAYDSELARQRANDELLRKFAGVANRVASEVDTHKDEITHSQAGLEEQKALVDSRITESNGFTATELVELQRYQTEIDEKGISSNPHSHYNAKDVSVLLEQYAAFLQSKKSQLDDELERKKMRGLTQSQYDEINAQFKEFDKNGNQVLSLQEFKSCLYSLGEEKRTSEIVALMEKYGTREGIKYDGFLEFMISQLGDTDTKEEILKGWELINKGAKVAKIPLLVESVLRDEDVDYIRSTAPAVGDDYDYAAWTDAVFAR